MAAMENKILEESDDGSTIMKGTDVRSLEMVVFNE